MKILLLGSGAREHALAISLAADPATDEVIIAPGNPGTAEVGRNIPVNILDGDELVGVARGEDVDLVVVGPEAPLVAGISDVLREAGFAVFGPSRKAARLEGSKAHAKEVMALCDVPTAMARVCTSEEEVDDALDAFGPPFVVKDDGLAAGKGVVVTSDRDHAASHAAQCLRERLGGAATEGQAAVVIEEFLDGPELSLFCISDGERVVPLATAQDYKRIGDGDTGPNTGGMGAYSPLEWVPEGTVDDVVERVAQPVINHMAGDGTPFVGLLYIGLALSSRGPRVIEFNVRFGDPETQVILSRLRTPLGGLLMAAATGNLPANMELDWNAGAAVGVVMATPGYPGPVKTGEDITGIEEATALPGVHVVQAGTRADEDRLLSAGGRVLTVVGVGDDVSQARARAYDGIGQIQLDSAQFRTDIAANAT